MTILITRGESLRARPLPPARCARCLPTAPPVFPQRLQQKQTKTAVFQFQKTNAVFVFSFLGANSSWEWLSESLSATTRRGLGSQLRRRQQRTSRQGAYGGNATRAWRGFNAPLGGGAQRSTWLSKTSPQPPVLFCFGLFWSTHKTDAFCLFCRPSLFFSGGRRRRGRGREGPPASGLVSFRGLCHSPRRAQKKIQKISEVASPTKYLVC